MLVRRICGPQIQRALLRGVASTAPRTPPSPAPAATAAPGIEPAQPAQAAPPPPAGPPPPRPPKTSLFRQLLRLSGVVVIGGLGYFAYNLYDSVSFPQQTAPDPSKPRLVVLGSGWGSVALLKTIDMANYNVTVVSPRNYFLFTPLLPSTATGLIEHRSIMEPTRAIIRKRPVSAEFVEGEVIKADFEKKTVTVSIHHNSHKDLAAGIPDFEQEVPFDKLVIGVGATTNTYGIKGVSEYACFLKEIEDTQKIRKRIMDCLEAASVPGLPKETRRRLMHAVVVGGGPTGVEFAGELHDFVYNDLRKFNPDVVRDFKVSLIEGLPQILPSGFNKQLVNYAIDTLEREQIDILTKTMVTKADEEKVYATRTNPNGTKEQIELPYGLFVWAGGIGVRGLIKDMMHQIPGQAQARRGLLVDEYLQVKGLSDVWAVGDCADAGLAPTAQVASQEGVYVGTLLNRLAERENLVEQRVTARNTEELRHIDRHIKRLSEFAQFKYSHQGSLAYIGSDKAVADVTWYGRSFASGGTITYVFWRSAYLSMVFSLRNKLLVALDWTKVIFFGRDISRE